MAEPTIKAPEAKPHDCGEPYWAIVELMGHRRLAGVVFEEERFGSKMLRLDVPASDGQGFRATQFYSGAALYCVTPCDEKTARAVARLSDPRPVQPWELPQLPKSSSNDDNGSGREDDDGGDYGDRELDP